jgi:hypothetical protein
VPYRQFLFLFFFRWQRNGPSIGFLSLPSVGVGVEAVRLVESIVEEVKVNKQMLADAMAVL